MKNLKTLVFVFLVINFSAIAQKQEISAISIGLTSDYHFSTQGTFDGLNKLFEDNNIPSLNNDLTSFGLTGRFIGRKNRGGMEVDMLKFQSNYISTNQKVDLFPLVKGVSLSLSYFRFLFFSDKWYSHVKVGMTYNNLRLIMVDNLNQGNSFSTLLANPTLSSTIDINQTPLNLGFSIYGSIYYRIKKLQSIFDDLDVGIKVGYYHSVMYNDVNWTVTGISNNFIVGGLPTNRFNHISFQISILMTFEFIQRYD